MVQGAQVVGNILGGQAGGSTGCTTQDSTGLDPSSSPAVQSGFRRRQDVVSRKLIFSAVAAAAFFGDVTHVANQTYNVESGAPFDGVSTDPLSHSYIQTAANSIQRSTPGQERSSSASTSSPRSFGPGVWRTTLYALKVMTGPPIPAISPSSQRRLEHGFKQN